MATLLEAEAPPTAPPELKSKKANTAAFKVVPDVLVDQRRQPAVPSPVSTGWADNHDRSLSANRNPSPGLLDDQERPMHARRRAIGCIQQCRVAKKRVLHQVTSELSVLQLSRPEDRLSRPRSHGEDQARLVDRVGAGNEPAGPVEHLVRVGGTGCPRELELVKPANQLGLKVLGIVERRCDTAAAPIPSFLDQDDLFGLGRSACLDEHESRLRCPGLDELLVSG